MNKLHAAAPIDHELPAVGCTDEEPFGHLGGRRWALVTDDLIDSLDALRRVETRPSAVLVPPRHYLLAKAEFPEARIGTHPSEVATCAVELAVTFQSGAGPVVRPCLVLDPSI